MENTPGREIHVSPPSSAAPSHARRSGTEHRLGSPVPQRCSRTTTAAEMEGLAACRDALQLSDVVQQPFGLRRHVAAVHSVVVHGGPYPPLPPSGAPGSGRSNSVGSLVLSGDESGGSSTTSSSLTSPHAASRERASSLGYPQVGAAGASSSPPAIPSSGVDYFHKAITSRMEDMSADEQVAYQYEHIRLLLNETEHFVVSLAGVCTETKCPRMIATEQWEFLCSSHTAPRRCCAIDYCLHVLDTCSTTVLSGLGRLCTQVGPIANPPLTSAERREYRQQFSSVIRRVYRIFAHSFYHHPEEHAQWEGRFRLASRFVVFGVSCNLLPKKVLIFPLPLCMQL